MGLDIAATRLLREESAAIARMLADSTDDVAIENGSGALATTQIERFAPGFSDRTAATTVCAPADFERDNPNNVGGDIKGGSMDLKTFFARPRLSATRTGSGAKATTCARHQHHQEEASRACADTSPPAAHCNTKHIRLRSRELGRLTTCLMFGRGQGPYVVDAGCGSAHLLRP